MTFTLIVTFALTKWLEHSSAANLTFTPEQRQVGLGLALGYVLLASGLVLIVHVFAMGLMLRRSAIPPFRSLIVREIAASGLSLLGLYAFGATRVWWLGVIVMPGLITMLVYAPRRQPARDAAGP